VIIAFSIKVGSSQGNTWGVTPPFFLSRVLFKRGEGPRGRRNRSQGGFELSVTQGNSCAGYGLKKWFRKNPETSVQTGFPGNLFNIPNLNTTRA
jgi:hypothetical protein